jgi:hypothetical protein
MFPILPFLSVDCPADIAVLNCAPAKAVCPRRRDPQPLHIRLATPQCAGADGRRRRAANSIDNAAASRQCQFLETEKPLISLNIAFEQ